MQISEDVPKEEAKKEEKSQEPNDKRLFDTIYGMPQKSPTEEDEDEELLTSVNQANMHKLIELDSTIHCKQFNIMVVGPAGVGKSSFIEIFLQKFNFTAFEREFGHKTGVR